MRSPRSNSTSPWIYGVGSLFVAGAIFFGLQQDQTTAESTIEAIVQQREQIRVATEQARALHAQLVHASRILDPYCNSQSDASTQLVFAALNLSSDLKPTINGAAANASPIPAVTPTPTPAPAPASAAASATTITGAVTNAARALSTTPQTTAKLTTKTLTTTYTGDFTSLVTSVNEFARKGGPLGVSISKISRGATSSTPQENAQTPLQYGAAPTPSPSPSPGNILSITATFNRPVLDAATCERIDAYANARLL
jgi:hypothetical protein